MDDCLTCEELVGEVNHTTESVTDFARRIRLSVVAVKFNVTLLDVVVVFALSILRVPVGASSSGELRLDYLCTGPITLLGVPSPLLLYARTLYQYVPPVETSVSS